MQNYLESNSIEERTARLSNATRGLFGGGNPGSQVQLIQLIILQSPH